MKLLEKLKEEIIARAASGIGGAIVALIGIIVYEVTPILLPTLESAISKRVLLSLLSLSVILNIIFWVLVRASSKKEKFILKFGFYWDKDKNPHCPACKTPVSKYGTYNGNHGFHCNPCGNTFYPLTDERGFNLSLKTAKEKL